MTNALLSELGPPPSFPPDFAEGWRTGVAYYRISDDPEHDELGVRRQRKLTRAKAERERIFICAEYVDDDRSAFTRRRRPGYEAFLEHAGKVDIALAYHPDRMTRGDLVEIERLIVALGGDAGTPISTVETADYDVATPHGRMIARITGSVARYASEHNARRIAAKMTELAEAGKVPGGRRAFGYSEDGKTKHPEEAPIVAELVARVLGGATCRELAAELNARGVKTTAGNEWHPGPLRQMLAGPRIAGLRSHKGRIVAGLPGQAPTEWAAIIDADQRARLLATLDARSPIGRRGRTPWLLTGLLRCESCGEPLVSNTDSKATGGARRYQCRPRAGHAAACGAVRIKAEPLEELLGALATERLADVEARQGAEPGPDDSAELAELNKVAADRLAVAEAGAQLSLANRLEEYAALDRRQRAVEARLAGRVREAAPLALVAAEGFVGRPWADLELAEQRRILEALIDHIAVAPASKPGSTKFEAGRVTAPGRIAWRV